MALTTEEPTTLRVVSPSPSSTTSGGQSGGDISENHPPATLAAEELLLAVNKESSEEELQKAIARCKELVLETEVCSPERKWLVRHLIELRLRLQECSDAMDPLNKISGVSKRVVKGHHLTLQPSLSKTSGRYCDHCTGTIWCVVQAWYQCKDCGYNCHYKCLSYIVRECVHVVVSEKGGYEIDICPELGLSAQKYLCAECGTPLPLAESAWTEARRCDYTGLYYCSACHWGSSAIIPARVIHNWDLDPQPICQASLQLLRMTADRPFIDLEKLNPRLFSLVHELNLVRRLRKELAIMKKYLWVCRNAIDDHLLWKTIDSPHLIESPNLYSLQNLLDTHSGELPTKLHTLIQVFSEHIKVKCEICKGRAHICEVCLNEEVLYPFDSNVVTCDRCQCVLHQNCFSRKRNKCPKCIRMQTRKQKDSVDFSEAL